MHLSTNHNFKVERKEIKRKKREEKYNLLLQWSSMSGMAS